MEDVRKHLYQRPEGQALIEYLLMLLIALGVFTTIAVGFRKPLLGFWYYFTQQVAAPCPGCAPPEQVLPLR